MKVLILTHRLPYAPNRGDRVRAHHIVKLLAARADVRVVSLVHDRDEAAQTDTLRQLGVGVATAMVARTRNLVSAALALPTDTPLTHALLHAPAMKAAIETATTKWRPDVVLAYCTGVAPLALAPPLDSVPFVLDVVDVDSAKWAAFAEVSSLPRAWIYRREARCLGAFERRAVGNAFAATVVNERERDTLLRGCRGADVCVVPNGVDVTALTAHDSPAAAERVIFTAVFDYAPNTEGALWFARRVWPLVRAALTGSGFVFGGVFTSIGSVLVRELDEPAAQGDHHCFELAVRVELHEEALDVAAAGQDRDAERPRDGRGVASLGQQGEHVSLASGQEVGGGA